MKKLSGLTLLACLSLGAALPATAQVTWNYAGSCAVSDGSTSTCTPSAGNTLITSAFTASTNSGSKYVAGMLTNQGASGIGMTSPGENTLSPNHAIDNSGNHEVVLLNFGSNLVTLQSISTGWSNTDTDISILRWTGATTGPSMTSTSNMANNGLASGWTLVKSGDLDGQTTTTARDFAGATLNTDLTVSAANSSSWWLVSSYFGANATNLDRGNDYFKLLSVTAKCVTTTTGGACGGTPPITVSEPGSLGLAGAALFGLAWSRRRRSAR